MDYDVLILGGGIIGCNTAYELSKYSLNIALLERNYDIANDILIVNSEYDRAVAYAEIAFDNGVNFKLEEEVLDIEKVSRGFRVTTNKNKFTCKIVINTIHNSDKEKGYVNIKIDDSLIDRGYIKVDDDITLNMPKIICEKVMSNIKCTLKKDFNSRRREVYRFRDMTNDERNRIIKMDKNYGKMVCLCHMVTEGEIIDSIRRPLGARTLKGVTRRTGVIFGDCHGAYCMERIISILARETGRKISDIVEDTKDSKLILGRIKEFDTFHASCEADDKDEIFTTMVRLKGSDLKVVPVKSTKPIKKSMHIKCSEALSRIYVGVPIKIGDIICKNILNLGVNIVCTKNADRS